MTAFIIATIHLNLCIGTLSHFLPSKPHLKDVIDRLMRFEACGEFMLTEVGHGLDARNLETTATKQQDGSFTLSSRTPMAAKAMPPTTPLCGMPRVAVVFARLLIDEEDHGVKTFLVQLSDEDGMCAGITSRPLPTRPGTRPLDHSITTFDNVSLPEKSLLSDPSKVADERDAFLRQIHRVSIGTLSLSIMGVAALKTSAYIVGRYSQRRYVGEGASRSPIFSFSTQYRPVLQAWTYATVLELYARWSVAAFMSLGEKAAEKHSIAVIFKVAAMRAPRMLDELSERCGWQGLFSYNQVKELSLTFQGNTVAEGDCLVLSIRELLSFDWLYMLTAFQGLVSELLGGKYDIPKAKDPTSSLAQRELALRARAVQEVARIGGYEAHRSQSFDRNILPLCRPLVEAIGDRMAFEAAKDKGVDGSVLELFEKFAMERHIDWYVGSGLTDHATFQDSVSRACTTVLPVMLQSFDKSSDKDYVYAPIVSSEGWNVFSSGLPFFHRAANSRFGLSKL